MTQVDVAQNGWTTALYHAMADVPAEDWDACAGLDDPLIRHSHLLALERSGIAAPENGYRPCHVMLRDRSGQAFAAAPAYLKSHSKGELGVDLGFAMAHGRAVGAYYPKLQVEVPMMPFGGKRLLIHPDVNADLAVPALLASLKDVALSQGASSVHIGYTTQQTAEFAKQSGFATTQTNTYKWRPGPEHSFEGFLKRMNSRRRYEIRKQRRRVAEEGLRFCYYRGQAISDAMASAFFDFYKENFDRHGSEIWLNRDYFQHVFAAMRDSIELCISYRENRWVGAVFSLVAQDKAYTQYWGQAGDIRFLHFEQVIYRGLERAYVTGLDMLDFGPTGAHKAERGLQSEAVYHAVWFTDQKFAEIAVAGFEQKTKNTIADRISETARLPFLTP